MDAYESLVDATTKNKKYRGMCVYGGGRVITSVYLFTYSYYN